MWGVRLGRAVDQVASLGFISHREGSYNFHAIGGENTATRSSFWRETVDNHEIGVDRDV